MLNSMNTITTRKNHYPTLQVSQIFYQRNKESLHKYSDLIIEMARKLYKNPSYNALKLVLRRKKLSTVGRKNHFQIQTGQKFQRQPRGQFHQVIAKYNSSQYMWGQRKTIDAYPAVSGGGCVRAIYH
jgi:hypothetical protein